LTHHRHVAGRRRIFGVAFLGLERRRGDLPPASIMITEFMKCPVESILVRSFSSTWIERASFLSP